MTRRELREHVFLMLFRRDFYNDIEELKSQAELYLEDSPTYLDDLNDIEKEDGYFKNSFISMDDKEKEYLMNKVSAIFEKADLLDEKINKVAKGWKTRRMSKVDLTIIRLALYEMLYDEDVPEKVAINEGVELAKKFGGDDSPSFVNGILAKLINREE
ncbi:MAG: transcription antitermination factor NusB [Lachnospiraceae bacterium]|nr:transcription antitermination factor NusB [Lachnospiraceae bacterium]